MNMTQWLIVGCASIVVALIGAALIMRLRDEFDPFPPFDYGERHSDFDGDEE